MRSLIYLIMFLIMLLLFRVYLCAFFLSFSSSSSLLLRLGNRDSRYIIVRSMRLLDITDLFDNILDSVFFFVFILVFFLFSFYWFILFCSWFSLFWICFVLFHHLPFISYAAFTTLTFTFSNLIDIVVYCIAIFIV